MLKKVKFSAEASREFLESVERYESKVRGLGLGFTDEIDSTIERIRLNPNMYLKVVEDIKKIQVNKFPYSLFYTTEDDTLIILRVFHNKRKPIKW